MTDSPPSVGPLAYLGLFFVSLATLMYEVLLTRIFSLTMWYHLAFVAVSIAMFGMTVGAILVYLRPATFTQARTKYHLAVSALLFAFAAVASFLTHLSVPVLMGKNVFTLAGLCSVAFTYAVIAVPFVLSGICISLALTRFPGRVSRLYAADLAGAAAGTVLLTIVLGITDAVTTVAVVAALAALGSLLFALDSRLKWTALVSVVTCLAFAAFSVVHTRRVNEQRPLVRISWIKGRAAQQPLYETWNSFSCVRVVGDPDKPKSPFGWGLSSVCPPQKIRELRLTIDGTAATPLTHFTGDLSAVNYLRYDVTNLAHYLRPQSDVLVVGSGGGRDILSALVFRQKSVVGVEINGAILETVNERFGDFTGHLDKIPGVTFINDEARSYIATQAGKWDILQISLIDTWAATAAGAFVLSENSLYTREAWRLFLDHLTPRGILSVSRWYFGQLPGETYRITALGSAALMDMGVADPRKHLMVVAARKGPSAEVVGEDAPDGVATLLVSREPFSAEDVDRIEELAKQMKFDLMLSPRAAGDATFEGIASGERLWDVVDQCVLNIAPPTDDSPFFFQMLRFRDFLKAGSRWRSRAMVSLNLRAVAVLGALLVTVVVLTLACIIVPLALTAKRPALKGTASLFVYFGSIGLAFMLVEISQMQRLIVFLGHPIYGLCVVLFTLLLASGLGSYSTRGVEPESVGRSGKLRFALLVAVLLVSGLMTPMVSVAFRGSSTPVRILVAAGILFPMGFCMGTAFPLGMKLAAARAPGVTAWLWGVNGATSVCASVFAIVISLTAGISASFWLGLAFYLLASLAFFLAAKPMRMAA